MGRAGVYLCGLLARLRGPPATPGGQALPLVQFADGGGGGGGHGGGGAGGGVRVKRSCFSLPTTDGAEGDASTNRVVPTPENSEVMFLFPTMMMISFQTCQSF